MSCRIEIGKESFPFQHNEACEMKCKFGLHKLGLLQGIFVKMDAHFCLSISIL